MGSNGKVKTVSDWTSNRWNGITRPYSWQDVERLRGSLQIECTLARHGAEMLWEILQTEPFVPALGALKDEVEAEERLADAGRATHQGRRAGPVPVPEQLIERLDPGGLPQGAQRIVGAIE